MDYFTKTKSILSKIQQEFDNLNINYGFIIGGGYGYESIKYSDTRKVGDIDCLLFLESEEQIVKLLSDKSFLTKLGFDISKSNKVYREDIDLYKKGIISLIRYSGYIEGIKTGFKIMTFKEIVQTYHSLQTRKSYLVSHGSNNCIFIAKGTNGSSLLLTTISLDISNLYKDNLHHFIWPYYNWYFSSDILYIGAWTDFIAKGLILKDNKSILQDLKKNILMQIISKASKEIITKKNWHKVFANNHLFSKKFKKDLNIELSSLALKSREKTSEIEKVKNQLVTVIPSKKEFVQFGSSSTYKIKTSLSGKNLYDLLKDKDDIEYEKSLHIINAEAKRLNEILNKLLADHNSITKYSNQIRKLIFDSETDTLSPFKVEPMHSLFDLLVEDTLLDFNLRKQIENKTKKVLLLLLIELRVNVIQYLTENYKFSINKFKFDKAFEKLYINRAKVNKLFNYENKF